MASPGWLISTIERLNLFAHDREVLAALFVTRGSMVAGALVSEGERDCISLPLRRIAAQAAETQARQILLVHTHPSGDPRPSAQDIIATRHLCALLRRLDMRLTDHLILTRDRYFSFRAARML